jgi:hypothetical protein
MRRGVMENLELEDVHTGTSRGINKGARVEKELKTHNLKRTCKAKGG